MAGWRDDLLARLAVNVPGFILVDDPDGLLLDEGVAVLLADREVVFVPYEDPMAFRHAYESGLREAAGTVVVRAGAGGTDALPWDLLRRGRRVRLGLDVLFPRLHHGTVAALGTEWLDRLAAARYEGPPLGERETLDHVLRHVASLDVGTVVTPERLLYLLLRRHFEDMRVPKVLDDYLIAALRRKPAFGAWPLERIVPDRELFFRFLQERWPLFVETQLPAARTDPETTTHDPGALSVPGPALLPFDYPHVRAYVDSLFLEGHLKPIEPPGPVDEDEWISVGLDLDPERARLRRVRHLAGLLAETLPPPGAHHGAWLSFAIRWGSLLADLPFVRGEDTAGLLATVDALRERVASAFVDWVLHRYDGLRTAPALPPTMLHHVARFLAVQRSKRGRPHAKIALVLADGMALEQWVTLSRVLGRRRPEWRLETNAVFAWLPTLTAVSRQAVFAGRPPHAFADTIDTSAKDAAGWEAFWAEQGLPKAHVRYLNVKGEPEDVDSVHRLVDDDRVEVVGLVVRKVDEIVHGAELGRAGVQNHVELWADGGVPERILGVLVDRGFDVYLTSDHGNTEAVGIGLPAGGLMAKERAERVRVYGTAAMRDEIAATIPGSIAWTPAGLPPGHETLFPPIGGAFTYAGRRLVTHGGLTVEELIVPFVHVRPTLEPELY